MLKLLDVLLLGRARFHELSMRGRVTLSQPPANLTLLLVILIVAVAAPETLADPGFVLGQAVAILIFVLCIAVPWVQLPYGLFLAVPFLDFIPLGLIESSAGEKLPGLALLALPVMCITGSGYEAARSDGEAVRGADRAQSDLDGAGGDALARRGRGREGTVGAEAGNARRRSDERRRGQDLAGRGLEGQAHRVIPLARPGLSRSCVVVSASG